MWIIMPNARHNVSGINNYSKKKTFKLRTDSENKELKRALQIDVNLSRFVSPE